MSGSENARLAYQYQLDKARFKRTQANVKQN